MKANVALDYETQPTYSVRLSVSDGFGGTFQRVVIVNINDIADTTRQLWKQQYFGTFANSGLTADTASFTGDGIPNLLKFAFGADPRASGLSALVFNGSLAAGGIITATGTPTTVIEPTTNGLDFRALFVRRKDHVAAGLTYVPQFSADLTTWQNSAAVPTVLADDGTYQIVSVPYPPFVGGKKARFFLISVTVTP
ncbi:MAG: hypothetical protein NTV80_07130 [Verrucomicrobia bacterium]|nr:hypothetical protein [Verrucomicrobiota bacterium]